MHPGRSPAVPVSPAAHCDCDRARRPQSSLSALFTKHIDVCPMILSATRELRVMLKQIRFFLAVTAIASASVHAAQPPTDAQILASDYPGVDHCLSRQLPVPVQRCSQRKPLWGSKRIQPPRRRVADLFPARCDAADVGQLSTGTYAGSIAHRIVPPGPIRQLAAVHCCEGVRCHRAGDCVSLGAPAVVSRPSFRRGVPCQRLHQRTETATDAISARRRPQSRRAFLLKTVCFPYLIALFWGNAMTDEDQKTDQRVAEFKLLAETAQRMAEKAESETSRADYLKIAKDWLQLATEIENSKG